MDQMQSNCISTRLCQSQYTMLRFLSGRWYKTWGTAQSPCWKRKLHSKIERLKSETLDHFCHRTLEILDLETDILHGSTELGEKSLIKLFFKKKKKRKKQKTKTPQTSPSQMQTCLSEVATQEMEKHESSHSVDDYLQQWSFLFLLYVLVYISTYFNCSLIPFTLKWDF